jgi:hypothetical protein
VRRIAFAAECLAEHELLQGAAESARKLLEPLLPSVETSSVDLLELLPVLARARLATSDVEGAETLIDQGARHVAATRSRIGFADVVWTRGMVRAAQGRRAEARHLFEASLSLVRSMNIPWQEGRILLEWGKMEAADGAVAEARDRLETALDLFERSGAQAFTSSTKAALHALDRSR